VAVKYPKDVIRGIAEMPTAQYHEWYGRLNERLDTLVTLGAQVLQAHGFLAVAQTRERVGFGESENETLLPHKTVATRAGIGWIGKSALLVTKEYGSMVRLSSILTDAPLRVAKAVNTSKCGGCTACTNACPAGAISGGTWNVNRRREEFFDAVSCRATARERAGSVGISETICGRCIAVCPHTRAYSEKSGE
jgi:epoxyqueuosine reductase QueG